MTKRPVKLLPIFVAISAVIIIAGVILFALLGFNYSAERPEKKTFEVEYGVGVIADDAKIDALNTYCEDAFKENGISVIDAQKTESVNPSNGSVTSGGKLIYTFSANVSDEALEAAKTAVEEKVDAAIADETLPETAQVYVSHHASYDLKFTEAAWRGAVAVAVGAIVALVYVGIRFGVGSALTGLTLCVHDVVFSLALLSIARIPLYFFAPIVIGGVAAFMSLLLWLIQCFKMRENFKDPSYATLSAEEAVTESKKTAKKTILVTAGALGIGLAVFGIALAIGGAALGAILLPIVCIIPVGVSLYSSLLFGPALHVHVKAAFDKFKVKHKRYVGKAKAEKAKEE